MVLEAARQIGEDRSQAAYNAAALQLMGLPAGASPPPVARIAIGFVDYGFDLLHPTLLHPNGAGSRFRHLWDQNAASPASRTLIDPGDVADWGPDQLDREIRAALACGSRRALDALYDPHANNCGRWGNVGGAHGTLMASIAAGTAVAGFRGAGPTVELIGVQLALLDHHWKEQTPDGAPTWLEWSPKDAASWTGWRSYDACPQIINAVRYNYDRGCKLGVDALVINLSIGAWGGAHQGRSPVETALAELVSDADLRFRRSEGPRLVIVAGAGNSGADEGHWCARIDRDAPGLFAWNMQRADTTQNKLEIWYEPGPSPLDATIGWSTGGPPLDVTPGATHEIRYDGVRVGIAEHVVGSGDGLSCIRLLVHPPLLPTTASSLDGRLASLVCMLDSHTATMAHAWIERDDGAVERSWLSPSHPQSTLCSIATAPGVLVVGGYDHHSPHADAGPALLALSGLGPAPWRQDRAGQIPHVSAPACRIWGARSKTRGFTETTGTSAAVALVSGAIAHHLGQAGAAASLPIPPQPWNPRWGHGPFTLDPVPRRGVVS